MTAAPLFQKEHYETLEMFERVLGRGERLDREDKALWSKNRIYQDGRVNDLFLAFRHGVAYGQSR